MGFVFVYLTAESKIFWIMVRQRNRRIHHDPRDVGLICLVKKRKILFRILSGLRIQSWISLKKCTLRMCTV